MCMTPLLVPGYEVLMMASRDSGTAPLLGGIDRIVPEKVDISKRGFLRLCDSGRAPWGIKLGGRRLWNLEEIDSWIREGCPPVRSISRST
jgi:hypothetical protein